MEFHSKILESVIYWLSKQLLTAYSLLAYKINLATEEEIPPGPKIFAINHPTTSDPFISMVYLKEKVHILVMGNLFKIPVFGFILKHTGQVPVYKEKGGEAFLEAKSLLQKGKSVVIFAEGILSPTGNEVKPKTGAVRLSLETKAPIIPIGVNVEQNKIKIVSTNVAHREETSAFWYLHGSYAVTIGKAIYLKGNSENRENVCFLSKMILEEIWRLGQKSQLRMELKNKKLYLSDFNNFFTPQKSFIKVLNQIILAIGLFRH